jgi:type II secretory pathway pseudopilin PulG
MAILQNKSQRNGYLMLELLLAIAILMIVMVAGFTNWFMQLKKAHDSQRKSDLHKIQAMLEQYYNDHDCFPDPGGTPPIDLNNPNICGSLNFIAQGIQKYPCDPETKVPYMYVPLPSCGGYQIYAKLTNLHDGDICTGGCGPGNAYNYGVSSGAGL